MAARDFRSAKDFREDGGHRRWQPNGEEGVKERALIRSHPFSVGVLRNRENTFPRR